MSLDIIADREKIEELLNKDLTPDLSNVEVIEPPSSDDDEPNVPDIVDKKIYENNHCGCVNSKLDGLLEVFDEETCTDILMGYYDACSKGTC